MPPLWRATCDQYYPLLTFVHVTLFRYYTVYSLICLIFRWVQIWLLNANKSTHIPSIFLRTSQKNCKLHMRFHLFIQSIAFECEAGSFHSGNSSLIGSALPIGKILIASVIWNASPSVHFLVNFLFSFNTKEIACNHASG